MTEFVDKDVQALIKKGSTPHGPRFGYKQVIDDQSHEKSHYSNPFNQTMRGAIDQVNSTTEDIITSSMGYGYKEPTDEEELKELPHYANPFN